MTTIEFSYDELSGLIDIEEERLCHAEDWGPGKPHPDGENAECAMDKVRAAFAEAYDERLKS